MTNSINRRAILSNLSRRVGPVFADMAANTDYPDGWGTSPHLRRSLPKTRCALSHSYKPAHGGYPGGTPRTAA